MEMRASSEDVHLALLPLKAAKRGWVDVKEGIRKYLRNRHTRG